MQARREVLEERLDFYHKDPSEESAQSLQLRTLARDVLACRKCAELERSRTLPVCGFGSLSPSVMFVGEAPGRLGADKYGIPFTGDRSGILLQKMLGEIGLSDSKPGAVIPRLRGAYITNLARCNPRGRSGKNRSPTEEEIENCSGFLRSELSILQPKVIATLGRRATEAFLGQRLKNIDYALPKRKGKYVVFPLHHPAFVIRGGGKGKLNEQAYKLEFLKLKRFLESMESRLEGSDQRE